jgi:hypothetical protein
VGSGYIAYCEGGYYTGGRGRGAAYDERGKLIKEFSGDGGFSSHLRNFVDALKSRNRKQLNAEVAIGEASANWCHLANIACRAGDLIDRDRLPLGDPSWRGLLHQLDEQLEAHGLDFANESLRASGTLSIDAKANQFSGNNAKVANALLRGKYRKGFELPG